ncbi:MAG: glyoxalase [Rhodospirillaceae bacterium]|jgi:catechol 2,3-dioxygenase-like lactoylglutathione lyase family enzyme|nr:glyoxalase [Rhodospirillaceae bacterium]MBT5458076.1 glyoxalase [Rhodospirillaceae bacterium]
MAFTGLYSTLFSAPDMKKARRFYADWGLKKVSDSKSGVIYETQVGSRVIVKPLSAKDMPPPAAKGMNFREMVWGVSSKKHLVEIHKELSKDRDVTVDKDGTLHCIDPNNIGVGFRVWKPKSNLKLPRTKINSYSDQERVDEVSTFYEQASPIRAGHIGFILPDLKAAEKFYKDRLGFWLSDRYAGGAAIFLRFAAKSQHHNLFMINSREGMTKYHHTAFEVRDIHEVFGGGIAFDKKGWETEVGPGRHPISSAYFWYFKDPCEGAVEYFTDSDYVTESWKPHNYRINKFSEWHLVDGIKQVDDGKIRPSMAANAKLQPAK